MDNSSRDKQLRYLAQSIRLKEAASPRIVRLTSIVTSLSILTFIGWASVTNVHEIAHTAGEIVPSGFQQVVQHLEGGIVKEIMVRDGDTVQAGQILMRLDGAGIEEDLQRAKDKALALEMQEERLRAFTEGRQPKFSEAAMARADLIRDQETFFADKSAAKEKEKQVIVEQINQKKLSIHGLQSDLHTAQLNFTIAKDLYQRRKELSNKGLIARVKMLESEQAYNQLNGQLKSLNSQIGAANSAIAEYEHRLASLSADNLDNANQQLDSIIATETENAEIIKKLNNRVARLEVKAPVKGIVKGLSTNTIGSVVQPGQVLMEIIPTDAPMVVDLKIMPRYIGHMRAGQDVQVKLSSFDFARYGSIRGKLDQISASTFTGTNGERYYQGRVNLSKNYVGNDPHNLVMPGMTVMADIITGDKTILEYLLKPIRNAISTSFTER